MKDVADKVQTLEMYASLDKIKTLPIEKQNAAKVKLVAQQVDYLTQQCLRILSKAGVIPKKYFMQSAVVFKTVSR